jgi:hypothetical protein
VKPSDLGEYEEDAREKQNIQDKVRTPTQTKSYGWHTPISPPQISKSRRIKGFGENISQLSLGVYVSHLYIPFLYMVSQKK